VGAIEGSHNRTVEKEYLLMIRSLRENGGFYADAPVVLLQPTENDISPKTLLELGKLGVGFIKDPIAPANTGRGFLNMPITCEYLAHRIKTDHMVWLDCDTLILKEPVFENLYDHEVSAHCNMLEYKNFYNKGHELAYNEDAQAQYTLKKLVYGVGTPEYYRHVNTWFIQAPRTSFIWREWRRQTAMTTNEIYCLKDEILGSEFISYSGQGKDKQSLDYALSSAEEIAMGMIHGYGRYEFREPVDTAHQYIDQNTRICHYDDWDVLQKLTKDKWVRKNMKEINKICR
jgi:hypothetical protein